MRKILYIEDDELMQRLVSTILTREGYVVDVVNNGKDGMLKLSDVNNSYDLVITDLMMPYANGFEILNMVNNGPKHVPAIIVSNLANEDMVLEGFRLGAADYIKKPIMAGELLIRVKRLFFNAARTVSQ